MFNMNIIYVAISLTIIAALVSLYVATITGRRFLNMNELKYWHLLLAIIVSVLGVMVIGFGLFFLRISGGAIFFLWPLYPAAAILGYHFTLRAFAIGVQFSQSFKLLFITWVIMGLVYLLSAVILIPFQA